jgi:hypothetical protein
MAKYVRKSKRLATQHIRWDPIGGQIMIQSRPTRRHCLYHRLVWIEKEHHSTRAHSGMYEGCNDCLPPFNQSARPSSPSKAMFAWVCDGSDWTRDFVAQRELQNHGIGDPSVLWKPAYYRLDACFASFGTPPHAHQAATTTLPSWS